MYLKSSQTIVCTEKERFIDRFGVANQENKHL